MRDVSFLPEEVQHTARYTNSGRDVMWPRGRAAEVVDALAAAGRVILGLDLRSDPDGITPPGKSTEIPWHDFDPRKIATATPEASRQAAHAALARLDQAGFDDYRWILVTWQA